jgi:sugar O-acyltransferase (sialic acid O-acetyltransferase NeuD family)
MGGLVVWGTTGQAKVLAEFAPALGFDIAVFVDNDPQAISPLPGLHVLPGPEGLKAWLEDRPLGGLAGAAAIGGWKGGDRLQILKLFRDFGLATPALIHPAAFVARDAEVGPGAQLLAGSRTCALARIGEGAILNTGASVDHECVIGPGAHLAPGAVLAGCVEVGAQAFIGPGAVVLPHVRIGPEAIVGAGAVVVRDIPPAVVAYGSPARVIRPVRDVGPSRRASRA